GVVADPDEVLGDVDRTNNVAFGPATLQVRNPTDSGADLVICGVTIPAFADLPVNAQPTAQLDDQLAVEVCLGNNGNAPVASARHAIFLSADDTLDPDDLRVGEGGGVALGAGDRDISEVLIDLSGDVTPGEYYLFAVADPDDVVEEQQEDNNDRRWTDAFRVVEPGMVEGVDLAIRRFELDGERYFWGQTMTGRLVLTNRGDTDVQRFFVVRLNAEPIDGGAAVQIGAINVPSLAAGAEETFEVAVGINRRLDAGDYRIVADADPTNGTEDVNRANNRRTFNTIMALGGEPDVDASVRAVTAAPLRVQAGADLTVEALLENYGGDPTGGLEVAVVLSADALIDASDVVLDQFAIDSLDGHEERALARMVEVPVGIDQQVPQWRVAVVIDPENRLTGETSEDNNVSFAPEPVVVEGAMGGCGEDEFEDNDTPLTAVDLAPGAWPGLGGCDQADWFSVAVPAGQVLDVAVAFAERTGRVDLELVDGGVSTPGQGLGGTRSAFVPAGNARQVLIGLRPSARLQYDLAVALTPAGDGPNLRARSVVASPALVEAGAPVGLAFEVVNVGGGDAPATEAGAYFGDGPRVMGARRLGSIETPPVAAGAAVSVQGRINVPDGVANGTYALGVRVDDTAQVAEGSEDDNDAFTSVRVDADQACAADDFEPNASPYEDGAVPLVAALPAGVHADLVACHGDDDWYAVQVAAGQRLTVIADFEHALGDLELALYAPDGETVIADSTTLQNREQVELLRAGQAGAYLVRIYLAPGDIARGNTYALTVRLEEAAACPDDPFEPNGSAEQAALLPDGVHDLRLCPGDEDWFRFAVPAGNTVSFQVASGAAGVQIALFDPDGQLIEEDDRRISHQAVRNGTYRLRARVMANVDVVYELRISGVSGVDLMISDVQLTRFAAESGADLRARTVLQNRRGDAANDVLVRFLLSSDGVADLGDMVLGERRVAAIEGAGTVEFDQRLTLPANAPPGDAFVLAIADPDRAIPDVRPSNNLLSTPFTVLAACMDDDAFENESRQTATPLEPGLGVLNDGVICPFTRDWYSLFVARPGRVRITLAFDNALGDLDLRVERADGTVFGVSETEADTEVVDGVLGAAGTLYIRVDGFDDARNDYELSWTLP
ncbi:MAG: hypothetical protein KC620_10725, partial [Myxococcales bacterium]|nr:hypothetical protein [Myxococcales bacterium]